MPVQPLSALYAILHNCVASLAFRATEGAARLDGLCLSERDHSKCLEEAYEHYCPVGWYNGELFDCSTLPNYIELTADYEKKYYCTCSAEHLQLFLAQPEKYKSPVKPLPPPHQRPRRITSSDVKDMFPKQYEMHGFCPVTYVDSGNSR